MSVGILLFVAAILLVVMVHETGHFLVAKAFGFKATKFFVGFGPTLWSVQRGETEYGVKAIPAGGFVKIVGMNPYEEVAPEDEPRSYPSRPRWQRALLLLAGSATHWPVAFVLLAVALATIGLPTNQATNEVASVELRSPAAESGFRPGDRIVAVGGRQTTSWNEIRAYIRDHAATTGRFTVERDGDRRIVTAKLGRAIFDDEGRLVEFASPGESLRAPRATETVVGYLGVSPDQRYRALSVPQAASQAGVLTWEITKGSVRGIGQVFSMTFDGRLWDAMSGEGARDPNDAPLGLVGAGRIAGESVEKGRYLDLIGLIVGITILVGLMNLLPLPPLDGGHLAVVAFEAVTGRAVDVRKLIPIAAAVIAFFAVLSVAVLYLDLVRPIRVPL